MLSCSDFFPKLRSDISCIDTSDKFNHEGGIALNMHIMGPSVTWSIRHPGFNFDWIPFKICTQVKLIVMQNVVPDVWKFWKLKFYQFCLRLLIDVSCISSSVHQQNCHAKSILRVIFKLDEDQSGINTWTSSMTGSYLIDTVIINA